jgi:hypothetical protein
MKIISFLDRSHQPNVVEKILKHCGLWAPTDARARPQRAERLQLELELECVPIDEFLATFQAAMPGMNAPASPKDNPSAWVPSRSGVFRATSRMHGRFWAVRSPSGAADATLETDRTAPNLLLPTVSLFFVSLGVTPHVQFKKESPISLPVCVYPGPKGLPDICAHRPCNL